MAWAWAWAWVARHGFRTACGDTFHVRHRPHLTRLRVSLADGSFVFFSLAWAPILQRMVRTVVDRTNWTVAKPPQPDTPVRASSFSQVIAQPVSLATSGARIMVLHAACCMQQQPGRPTSRSRQRHALLPSSPSLYPSFLRRRLLFFGPTATTLPLRVVHPRFSFLGDGRFGTSG